MSSAGVTLLDDAINQAKREGNVQLAEWLRRARGAESAARWYADNLREAHRAERKILNENKKLRELVRDMWGGMCARCGCRDCAHYELYEGQRIVGRCEYYRRICELGIEVEE